MPHKVVENEQAKILWAFHIQEDKTGKANQLNMVIIEQQSKAVVMM